MSLLSLSQVQSFDFSRFLYTQDVRAVEQQQGRPGSHAIDFCSELYEMNVMAFSYERSVRL
jgi:hypothetical protein